MGGKSSCLAPKSDSYKDPGKVREYRPDNPSIRISGSSHGNSEADETLFVDIEAEKAAPIEAFSESSIECLSEVRDLSARSGGEAQRMESGNSKDVLKEESNF